MKEPFEPRHMPDRDGFEWVIWNVGKDKFASAVEDQYYAQSLLKRYNDYHGQSDDTKDR